MAFAPNLFGKARFNCSQPGSMRFERDTVETEEQLAANAEGWGIKVGIAWAEQKRYGYQRVVQITKICELVEEGTTFEPPPGAVYYPHRVYLGAYYEQVLKGEAHQFNADVKAKFLTVDGSIEALLKKSVIRADANGRGLTPTHGGAVFTSDLAKLKDAYHADLSSPASIMVDYRKIPQGRSSHVGRYAWERARNVDVNISSINVLNSGVPIGTSSIWHLYFACATNGEFQVMRGGLLNANTTPPWLDVEARKDTMAGVQYALPVQKRLRGYRGDTVQCRAWGTFGRTNGDRVSLPQSTPSAAFDVGRSPGRFAATMQGADANVAYDVSLSVSDSEAP